jgi:uncharacterized protein (DUF1810 family)
VQHNPRQQHAAAENTVFIEALKRYFGGRQDALTLERLQLKA